MNIMATIENFVTNRGNAGLLIDGYKFRKKIRLSKTQNCGDALKRVAKAAAKQTSTNYWYYIKNASCNKQDSPKTKGE